MREYIHFFENSGLRDTYENGSDYTEPYVSYTPVINEYKAQFNGEIVENFKIKKIQGGYKVERYGEFDELITEEEVLTNSDSFYCTNDSFIFPEDLNLTEESTEFNLHGGPTFYLEYYTNNTWNIYRDSRHTQENGLIRKLNVISVLSTSTDFVHYNKITPERITAKFIVVNDYAAKDAATLRREIARDSRLLEQIYINGTPIMNVPLEEIPTRFVDYSINYTFEEEGTYDIEYVLKKEYAGTIPSDLFPYYQYFSEIIIPKGVTTIKEYAFYSISNNPYSEINVIIPNTITLVEDNAVYCSYLNSSTIEKFTSINPNSIYTGPCKK